MAKRIGTRDVPVSAGPGPTGAGRHLVAPTTTQSRRPAKDRTGAAVTRHACVVVAAAFAIGCGGSTVESPAVRRAPREPPTAVAEKTPEPPSSPALPAAAASSDAAAAGRLGAESNPIKACDLADSLQKAAGYVCADGTRPLAGDQRLAHAARSDTSYRPGTDDRVDAYDVPCPDRPVRIYVEIQPCPEAAPEPARAVGPSMYDKISQLAAARDFSGIVAACDEALGRRSPDVETRWECAKNGTAARLLLGNGPGALSFAGDWCRSFSNEETRLDIAASAVTLVTEQRRSTKNPIGADKRAELSAQLARACSVPPKDVDALVSRQLW
jgi:hypothetical protein